MTNIVQRHTHLLNISKTTINDLTYILIPINLLENNPHINTVLQNYFNRQRNILELIRLNANLNHLVIQLLTLLNIPNTDDNRHNAQTVVTNINTVNRSRQEFMTLIQSQQGRLAMGRQPANMPRRTVTTPSNDLAMFNFRFRANNAVLGHVNDVSYLCVVCVSKNILMTAPVYYIDSRHFTVDIGKYMFNMEYVLKKRIQNMQSLIPNIPDNELPLKLYGYIMTTFGLEAIIPHVDVNILHELVITNNVRVIPYNVQKPVPNGPILPVLQLRLDYNIWPFFRIVLANNQLLWDVYINDTPNRETDLLENFNAHNDPAIRMIPPLLPLQSGGDIYKQKYFKYKKKYIQLKNKLKK